MAIPNEVQIPYNNNDMTFLGLNILGHDVIHDFGKADSDRWVNSKNAIDFFLKQPSIMKGGNGEDEITQMQQDKPIEEASTMQIDDSEEEASSMQIDDSEGEVLKEFIDEDDSPVNIDNYEYYIYQFQDQTSNIALFNCFDMYTKNEYKFVLNKEIILNQKFNFDELLFFCIKIFNPAFTIEDFKIYNYYLLDPKTRIISRFPQHKKILINIYNELGYNFFKYLLSKIYDTGIYELDSIYELDFSFIFSSLKDYVLGNGISLDLIDFIMIKQQEQKQQINKKRLSSQITEQYTLPQINQQYIGTRVKRSRFNEPLPEISAQSTPQMISVFGGGNLDEEDLSQLYKDFIQIIEENIINVITIINNGQGTTLTKPDQVNFFNELQSLNNIVYYVRSGSIDKNDVIDSYNTNLKNIVDYFYNLCNEENFKGKLGFDKFENKEFFEKLIKFCIPQLISGRIRKNINEGLIDFTQMQIIKDFKSYIIKQDQAKLDKIKQDKAALLQDVSGNLNNEQKAIVNDFAAFIAKSALYVNNVSDYNGNLNINNFQDFKNTNKKSSDSMLKTEIGILYNQAQKGGIAWGPGPNTNIIFLAGDLDETLLKASQKPGPGYALNAISGKNALKICTSGDKSEDGSSLGECRKYIINNAANLSKLSNEKKQKVFCPLTSIIDAQANCSWNSSKNYGIEYNNMKFTLFSSDNPKNYFYQGSIFGANELDIQKILPTDIKVSINFTSNIFNFNDINSFKPNVEELEAANILYKMLNNLYNLKFKDTKIPQDYDGLPFKYIWDLGEDQVKVYLKYIYFILFKGVGDLFQEINAVAGHGSYLNIPPNYFILKGEPEIARITKARSDAARLFLANDRPSAVRFGFMLVRGTKGINNFAYGGYFPNTQTKTTIFSKPNINIKQICQQCVGDLRGGYLKRKNNKKYNSIKNRKYKNKKKNQTLKAHKKYSNSRKVFKSKTRKYKSLPKKRNNKSYKKKKYSLKHK